MKKRVLSLALCLAMLFSLCVPCAEAAVTANQIQFVIDLTSYTGRVEVKGSFGEGIEIKPGTRNEISYGRGKTIPSVTITLLDFAPESYDNWKIQGEMVKAPLSDYLYKDSENQKYFVTKSPNKATTAQITLSDNTISFTRIATNLLMTANNWGSGAMVEITPVFAASGYIATAKSADAQQGTVSAEPGGGNNVYVLKATAGAGYSFDYWRNDIYDTYPDDPVYQLRENPYTVTLEQNEAYTAYFRTWNEATVSASPASGGTVTAERLIDDEWKLTATPQEGYTFRCWERADGTSTDANPLVVELGMDTAYTAHFSPPHIYGITSAKAAALPPMNLASGETGNAPIPAGTLVRIDLQFDIRGTSSQVAHSKVEVYAGDEAAVKAGTATRLGQAEGAGTGIPTLITVNPWPAGIDKLTVKARTDGCDPCYSTVEVRTAPAGEGLELNYLSMPQKYGVSSSKIYGPDLYGMAVFVDKQTGTPAVYAAGLGGVFELGYGGKTDMVRMKGMEDLGNGGDNISMSSYALAVGGPDVGDLTALVRHVTYEGDGSDTSTISTAYELRHYDTAAGQWETVAGSAIPPALAPEAHGAVNTALIMDGDDVWTDKAHWDGKAWTAQDYGFSSFLKLGADTAYGIAKGGTYRYTDGTWSSLALPGTLLDAAYDGRLLVGLTDGGYAVVKGGAAAASYPAVGKSVLGDIWTSDGAFVPQSAPAVHHVGFGGDGQVYALAAGSSGSYVLRGAQDGWQLMDTAEAFGVGSTNEADAQPTSIKRISSPAEGVTVLYGEKGSLYLQTAYYTITFNSNGGSAVAPLTGQTWSPVSVPRPTKEGYVFAGWFYDTGTFKQPWSQLVIPASNITLYAKWMEKGAIDPNDKYGEDRAKALAQLDQALDRMDQRDYTEENWLRVLQEYDNGLYAIQVAMPDPGSDAPEIVNKAIADTIYAALNAALNRMNAVPTQSVGSITVAVSVDADTIGLGYLVRPTLVTVPKYTRASQVITDLLSQNGLRWTNTGTVNSSFYLSGIRPVDQTSAKPANYLMNVKDFYFNEADRSDKLLSEFDYNQWSGWMYSIGDSDNAEYPSFPGVGCSEWRMIDGEVMRWQFTAYGYGADLNADNSAWGSSSLVPDAGNKSELTWAVAALRRDKSDAVLEKDENFVAAIKVLENPAATQAQIDSAYEALTGGSKPVNPDDETSITTRPEVTPDASGEAKVELKEADLADIIDRVKEEGAGALVIEPAVDGAATKVTVELPRQSVADLVKDTDAALVVSTEIAKVRVPTAALAELAGRSGSTVSISAEALKDKNGNPNGQVKVEITVGGAAMETLSGGITVTIPAKEPTAGTVMMIVTDEGSKILKKSSVSGRNVAALLDGSATVIVKDNSKTFSDVPDSYWGKDAVTFAASHELFQGTAADTFEPAGDMTRSMLVTVLWRLEDEAKTGTSAGFSDVDGAAWYGDAVQWAASIGIVTGTGDGFDPDGKITREQLSTMLYRYAGAAGLSTAAKGDLDKFTDGGTASGWAGDALAWAVGSGLIGGKGNATLDPSGTATRAEVATIFQRLVALMVK
ncbi:hypothetical protein CE91St41_24880 [Oscillospiraceae bacterium]|nr:hypothetical protein CE91St40_12660 [Oscillospiraceae bacterium]BDF75599.1 hypothetical protein CE91St41_24880 [Oscillospiraceae bacterium]